MSNLDIEFEKLAIVVSITDMECFETRLKPSLSKVGVDFTYIETNPSLPLAHSYNSIVKYNNFASSKYVIFIHQDMMFNDDWGKKLVEVCDSLPDFGFGGGECITYDERWFHCTNDMATFTYKPEVIETCDDSLIVIPTRLFLERQFDESFPWYPFAEDYAVWVQLEKKLKAYCLGIWLCHMGCWNKYLDDRYARMGFERGHDYRKYLADAWYRMADKWSKVLGRRVLINTTVSSHHNPWLYPLLDERRTYP